LYTVFEKSSTRAEGDVVPGEESRGAGDVLLGALSAQQCLQCYGKQERFGERPCGFLACPHARVGLAVRGQEADMDLSGRQAVSMVSAQQGECLADLVARSQGPGVENVRVGLVNAASGEDFVEFGDGPVSRAGQVVHADRALLVVLGVGQGHSPEARLSMGSGITRRPEGA
jgi:hypothetical protein